MIALWRTAAAAVALLFACPGAAAPAPVAGQPEAKPLFVQDYEPKPAILRVSDADTTIYIFGTTHALAPGFRWRSPKLDAVIKAADELVLETADGSAEDKAGMEYMDQLIASPAKLPPLLMRVPEDKRPQLRRALAKLEVPEQVLDLMPTWLAVFGMAITDIEGDGMEFSLGVEEVLTKEFSSAGKPIGSIESPVSILRGLSDLPEAVQTRLLVEAADFSAEAEQEEVQDPFAGDHKWAQGDLEGLFEGLGRDELGPELYDLMITKRNSAWADWFANRLERPGTVLVAVGAGHLAGPDSLQRKLAVKGLTAERVD